MGEKVAGAAGDAGESTNAPPSASADEENATAVKEMFSLTGRLIVNAVALFLSERIELPAIRKVARKLARARKPDIEARLDALMREAERHAETRNIVAHNPPLFSDAFEPLPRSNIKKPVTVLAEAELPAKSRAIAVTASALRDLYVETFGKQVSFDNISSPLFGDPQTESR